MELPLFLIKHLDSLFFENFDKLPSGLLRTLSPSITSKATLRSIFKSRLYSRTVCRSQADAREGVIPYNSLKKLISFSSVFNEDSSKYRSDEARFLICQLKADCFYCKVARI